MAEKEATVYVVDVSHSMGKLHSGREQSDLDWALTYVWDKIATTIGTGRKTLFSGVLAFRTDETKNEYSDDDSYHNIVELKPLGQLLMPDLRSLQSTIKPSSTNNGDAISALVLAIQMIAQFCKHLKYIRKIILVTNGTGAMDLSHLSDITKKIKDDNIQLTVLGVDFDDVDFGFKEDNKDSLKSENEKTFKSLAEDCEGMYGTLAEAITELEIPNIKKVKPVPSYKGYLTLGSPEQYSTAMSIDVERYPRVMIAKPPSATIVVVRSELDAKNGSKDVAMGNTGDNDGKIDEELAAVRNDRTYQVKDEKAPGGKLEVDRDDLARGYEYGRTAVPISESEENITKLETRAGLEIMGFLPLENIEPYMSMSRSNIIIPMRTNEKAIMALSSLIHSLFEQNNGAVARLVTKDGAAPSIVLLTPSIESDYECLIELELPFAEDVRSYTFPPLDRVVTMSGKVLSEHRFLPNKTLQAAMDAYVDKMDISSLADSEDGGEPSEWAAMEDTFSPMLHRVNAAVRYKAINPSSEIIPAPAEIITRYSHPPASLVAAASAELSALRDAADIKKVPELAFSRRARGDRRGGARSEPEQPLSGLDVSALLSDRSAKNAGQISPDNAIPEFKQLLSDPASVDVVKSAVSQLAAIVNTWVADSFGTAAYDRAVEALGTMRSECLELDEPALYNTVLHDLKSAVQNDTLGGDRRELWWRLKNARLGLVDSLTSSVSDVSREDAAAFWRLSAPTEGDGENK